MASKNRRYSARAIYVRKVRRLQSKGLLGDVDFRKRADPRALRAFDKYSDVLAGRATAVKVPSRATARELRTSLQARGRGSVVVIPKESKREKIRYSKRDHTIVSTRPGYESGDTITKKITGKFTPPQKDQKAYYSLRERTRGRGKLKRQTFSSFDEMLYYLEKYDINFEDIEDNIEVETVTKGGRKDKRLAERARYRKRAKRSKAKTRRKTRRR